MRKQRSASPQKAKRKAAARHPSACTIIARNYLPHAKALAESYLRHHPGSRFYLLAVDRLPDGVEVGLPMTVIDPDELSLSYFYEMCFKYDVTELSTAVKPTFLSLLLEKYGEEQIIFFDPDILIARPLVELEALLPTTSIVLTPHLLEPIPLDGKKPSETDILMAGAYNLGFIGVRKSQQTRKFLSWWEHRLRDHCMVDTARGLMTDQKWIDLIPGMFPEIQILRDPTYNVAYWNIHSRPITRQGKNNFFASGKPLAFYHFSGFDPRRPTVFSKHQDRTEIIKGSGLAHLLNHYSSLLKKHGYETTSQWEYGYARFENGIRVNRMLRQLYLKLDKKTQADFGDPFHATGSKSFLHWATTPRATGELSPFLENVYRMRFDLIAAFPDIAGQHREPFLNWVRETGTREMGFEPELATMGRAGGNGQHTHTLHGIDGINICGYLRNESGLGSAARGYIRAIQQLGLQVALKDVSTTSLNRSEDTSLDDCHTEHPYPVNLICINPEQHFKAMPLMGESFFKDRYNIAVWAWELPRFPDKWQDRFQYYDEIWVGSSFIADALAPSSPVPIIAIPPVLTSLKKGSREAGRKRIDAGRNDFVFLFIFDFHSYFERKNPLGVIAAFKAAFKRAKHVKLVIKCVNEQFKPEQFKQMEQQARGYPISIRSGYWTAEQMRDLTEACDCYVSLHRAEGTGLTIADAMALGKPVIATGWSGNIDFMNAFNSYLVRFKLVQLSENVGPYRAGETWAEPLIEHAAELMKSVYQNQTEAISRGRVARTEIEEKYSPAAIGELIRHRLGVIGHRRQYTETRTALHNGQIPHKHIEYEEMVQRVRDLIGSVVPADGKVMIISKGDDRLMNIDGRKTSHFPQNADGVYAGYHPADGAMAIAHLEARRKEGIEYLALPNTAFWWLDHYTELKHHLDTQYKMIAKDETCLIFHLTDTTQTPVLRYAEEPGSSAKTGLSQLIASLESRLCDVQESLRQHAAKNADEATRRDEQLSHALQQMDAHTAAVAADAIARTRQQTRVNELATLIESHVNRLQEQNRATGMRINELATNLAAMRGRAAPRIPTPRTSTVYKSLRKADAAIDD